MSGRRDTIVIGGSAGSVGVLRELLARLPADLPASIAVVVHVSQTVPSHLAWILSRSTKLEVAVAADGAKIRAGQVLVAPPGQHLAIEDETVRLWDGPRENYARPAIDVLFRSAAVAHGPRVIGVLLSGMLYDGSAGLEAIRARGGTTVAQDPGDAEFPAMPQAAIDSGQADAVVRSAALAETLVALVSQEASHVASPDDDLERELAVARGSADETVWSGMQPSPYICPDCGGPIRRARASALPRFRCRLGHAFDGRSLVARQSQRTDEALWYAARIMDDRALLFEEMAGAARGRGQDATGDEWTARAGEAHAQAATLRTLISAVERDEVG